MRRFDAFIEEATGRDEEYQILSPQSKGTEDPTIRFNTVDTIIPMKFRPATLNFSAFAEVID